MQKRKMKIFLSDKIVRFSKKNSPKNVDLTSFPRKFPVFCVLTLPPGVCVMTQKMGKFLGKQVKSPLFSRKTENFVR